MVPTAGGQYHWVSILAPSSMKKFLSYITGLYTTSISMHYTITLLISNRLDDDRRVDLCCNCNSFVLQWSYSTSRCAQLPILCSYRMAEHPDIWSSITARVRYQCLHGANFTNAGNLCFDNSYRWVCSYHGTFDIFGAAWQCPSPIHDLLKQRRVELGVSVFLHWAKWKCSRFYRLVFNNTFIYWMDS